MIKKKQKISYNDALNHAKRAARLTGSPFIMIASWSAGQSWDNDYGYLDNLHYYIIPIDSRDEAYSYNADLPFAKIEIKKVTRTYVRQLKLFKKSPLLRGVPEGRGVSNLAILQSCNLVMEPPCL